MPPAISKPPKPTAHCFILLTPGTKKRPGNVFITRRSTASLRVVFPAITKPASSASSKRVCPRNQGGRRYDAIGFAPRLSFRPFALGSGDRPVAAGDEHHRAGSPL